MHQITQTNIFGVVSCSGNSPLLWIISNIGEKFISRRKNYNNANNFQTRVNMYNIAWFKYLPVFTIFWTESESEFSSTAVHWYVIWGKGSWEEEITKTLCDLQKAFSMTCLFNVLHLFSKNLTSHHFLLATPLIVLIWQRVTIGKKKGESQKSRFPIFER